jgi:NAD(P)-dependent dehydrogenase (short-subunit alcohol dehydrogenase family)
MDLGLRGKRALVTGANRGTGQVIAETLAREGATVFVHGTEQHGHQQVLAEQLRASGLQAHAVCGELHHDAGADQLWTELTQHVEGLDILVNNYGGPGQGNWHQVEHDAWLEVYERNVLSAVRMIDRAVPGMRARGFGRVVQLATIGVLRPNRRMPHYYASKAAMANLTASLAKDVAGTGITVNTISPGLIHTEEVEAGFRALAARRGWADDWATIERLAVAELMPNPCARLAQRQEVADLVAFVVSERAGYLHGVQLRIDGGATDLAF